MIPADYYKKYTDAQLNTKYRQVRCTYYGRKYNVYRNSRDTYDHLFVQSASCCLLKTAIDVFVAIANCYGYKIVGFDTYKL